MEPTKPKWTKVAGNFMKIGLLGCGNVGLALVQAIDRDRDNIREKTGVDLVLSMVAVRDKVKDRPGLPTSTKLTDDPFSVVGDPDVDLVVELIGGLDPARELVSSALRAGKPVVTGNKELLAECWTELYQVAFEGGVDLLCEAAVAGAIPLVRALRESLAGDHITSLMGIVNGTTNYILTSMCENATTYEAALGEAQRLGFAEANPSADVDGHDSAAKAAIMATIAFGQVVRKSDVYVEGISKIDSKDFAIIDRLGYTIKLLAVAEAGLGPTDSRDPQGGLDRSRDISVRVVPAMIPKDHPLSGVRGSFNAVFLKGDLVGEMMLYGRGAGGPPTAAAVLGDIVDAAHNLTKNSSGRIKLSPPARLVENSQLSSQFFLSIDVDDRPGVLAMVAGIFGENNVSIRSMEQLGLGSEAHLVFLTHRALEIDLAKTLDRLTAAGPVKKVGNLLRVMDDDNL